jgi:tRNA A37 N6-isopentenylltransferase MiaA
VTSSEMHGVPHHCIDVFEPSDDIGANNAAQFCALARSCIDDIITRGATPIVVGGSGMYLSFLLYGSPSTGVTTPSTSPPSQRPQSPTSAASTGLPSSNTRSPHSNDAYRIKRRRDIEAASGCVPVYPGLLPHRHLLPLDYNFVCVSLWCERVASFRRIDRRVEQMVCDGLLVEVLRLYGSGCLRASSMAARAIGYRHALQFLAEHQNVLLRDDWIEEFDSSSAVADQRQTSRLVANNAMHDALLQFITRMQAATRQYSTRQLTWFKGDKRWLWFDTQPSDGSVDVGACAHRLLRALASDPPAASSAFAPTLPPLTKAEVILIYCAGTAAPSFNALQASNLKRYAPTLKLTLEPAVRQQLLLQARSELQRVSTHARAHTAAVGVDDDLKNLQIAPLLEEEIMAPQ